MTYRYLTIKVAGKTKLKHRHVMELHIGRPLASNEHVHHKDENIRNNDISNLELMTAAKHQSMHKQKHPLTSQCKVCGGKFTPAPTKRARAKTCSKPCANELRSRTERATKSRPPLANFKHEREIARVA